MFRGVILVFSGVMLGFRRVIFGSEGLYRVQWGYVVSIQHVDLPPCRAGSAVKTKTPCIMEFKLLFVVQLGQGQNNGLFVKNAH